VDQGSQAGDVALVDRKHFGQKRRLKSVLSWINVLSLLTYVRGFFEGPGRA
jgi:hypothetical protein